MTSRNSSGFVSPAPAASASPPPTEGDIKRVVELAYRELDAGHNSTAAAIAMLVLAHAPQQPAVQPLLFSNASLDQSDELVETLAEHHLVLAEAHRLLGDKEQAESHYRQALMRQADLPVAHAGLALLRMEGDDYLTWLDRLYAARRPKTVIEIGVDRGESIARVKPPTIAIGVDPNPALTHPLTAQTHILSETSDAFFARRGPDELLNGDSLDIGFIDGLHLYEQALKDFMNLERYSGSRSIILFHDTIPLDEVTQRRSRVTQFYTGDVWKTVLCLRRYRPDLDVFTIPAPWTGLTVVTGLDSGSRLLSRSFDEAVARFIDLPYSELEKRLPAELNFVANDWTMVEARLKARRVL